MDSAWYEPIAFGLLVLACIVMGVYGSDSRPGFSDGRSEVKDRWFIHSKDDLRR